MLDLAKAGRCKNETRWNFRQKTRDKMKDSIAARHSQTVRGSRRGFVLALTILFSALGGAAQTSGNHGSAAEIVPPNETAFGLTYAEHSAGFWQWYIEQPLENHPGTADSEIDLRAGQKGKVWYLAGNGGVEEVTIPAGKAVLVSLLNAEVSNIEEPPFFGATEEEQREAAIDLGNHIVELNCWVDGTEITNLEDFRVTSPQFTFEAPTPWIFGAVGGEGTAVGDGYYVLLRPLAKGIHTMRFTGIFRFTLAEDGFDLELVADQTFLITVR
jgi:hypothetical protein